MRTALICLTGLALLAACSKPPADPAKANPAPQPVASQPAAPQSSVTPAAPAAPAASAPQVSGLFVADGKPATLTQVTAHKDDPFDGKPITALVFSANDQAGDANAATDAMFRKFGDAIVLRIEPDGTVIGAQVIHSGLKEPGGSVSISGVMSVADYKSADGEISGRLTSNGPTDVFDQKLQVDLTFRAKAP
jgi:hypothetical protein